MSIQAVQPGLPQVKQWGACSPVQLTSPPSRICDGPFQKVTHLHPSISIPATDTKVTLNIHNGQKCSSLEANLCDTVDQVKKQIMQERKFRDLGSFGLLYGNRELEGPKMLGQQNVKNLAMLLIIHKCHGG